MVGNRGYGGLLLMDVPVDARAEAEALEAVFPVVPRWAWLGVLLAINAAANMYGVESTTKASMFMLACELIFLVAFMAICVSGLTHHVGGAQVTLTPLINPSVISPGVI